MPLPSLIDSLREHTRSIAAVLSLLVCAFLLLPYLAAAQGSAGITIKPAVIEETLDPGEDKTYSITVQNIRETDEVFYVYARNISGVKDGGVPIFANSNLERTGFELADWVELPQSEVLIPANGQVTIDYTIRVPESASPGSHFGGVFFSVDPPNIDRSGAAVGYQVSNIITIRVSGDVKEEANIRQFSTSRFLYGSQNVDFSVRIENAGNVLIRPTGPLEIYNMLGKKVDTLTFNEDQNAVFPKVLNPVDEELNGMREFELTWIGEATGFGRYEAILSPIYGEQGAIRTMSSTVTFWVLPMHIIGPALGILAFILLLVFIFVRLYIRRSLAHLHQGRRIVRQRRRGGSSALLLVTVVSLAVTALFLIVLLALFA